MRPSRRILTIAAAILILITTLSAAIPRAFNPHQAAAGAPPVAFLIDCDTTTPDIQSNCVYPSGTTTLDVAVVLQNNGPAFEVGAVGFTILSTPRPIFIPTISSCDASGLNCNPNFNQTDFTGSWQCSPPSPAPDLNNDGDPNTSQSNLGCFNSIGDGPVLNSGSSTLLGTLTFSISGEDVAPLSLREASIYDDAFIEMGSCGPTIEVVATCTDAIVQVGSNTSTPTNTVTITPTPTSTPAPQMTPPGTPTGAVTGIVALNEAICIAGAAGLRGVPATTAAFSCQGISEQTRLQTFVACLIYGSQCPNQPGPNEIFVRPQPADFASIDIDGDRIQQNQPLEVLAFVDADYPVLFETTLGTLISSVGNPAGQSLLCYTNAGSQTGLWDPDCDANPATVGDGVVAIRLIALESDPRGAGTVTVTQNGVSKQLQFTVTGGAKTISFESLDGKTHIETGADSCDPVLTTIATGSTSPQRTHIFARALDDQGVPVVGALLTWDTVFNTTRAPQGGTALPQLPTWVFDEKGPGAVLVACGGDAPDSLSIRARFDPIFSPGDPNYRTTFTIPVVDPQPAIPPPGESSTDIIGINTNLCFSLGRSSYRFDDQDCLYMIYQEAIRNVPQGMQDVLCKLKRNCPAFPDPDRVTPQRGMAEDFAPINADANRVATGDYMTVIVFPPAIGPVTFEADSGQFVDTDITTLGYSFDCAEVYDSREPDCVVPTPPPDPPCGEEIDEEIVECPDPLLPGDGMVSAILGIDASAARGLQHVTVRQGDWVRVLDFTVTGPPVSMLIEEPDGRRTLDSHESACTFPYTTYGAAKRAQQGYDDPSYTAKVLRVFDSDGVDVVGARADVIDLQFPTVRSRADFLSMDLGDGLFGAPVFFCSDRHPGTYEFELKLGTGGAPNSALSQSLTLFVVPGEGVPTLTPTPTITQTPVVPTIQPAPTTGIYLALDCDLATFGVQSICSAGSVPGETLVGVTLVNVDVPAFRLGVLGFNLVSPLAAVLAPTTACASPVDCNPDLDDDLPGTWICSPPPPSPDADPSPDRAVSVLGCFTAVGDGPMIAPGSAITLASVRYAVIGGGTQVLEIREGSVYDEGFGEIMSCNPTITRDGGVCIRAQLTVDGEAATSTATTTPVPTDTPTSTPTVTPTSTLEPSQRPALSLHPQDAPIHTGEAFSIDIAADRVRNLGAYEFVVVFDPQAMRYEGIGDYGFLGSTGRPVFCPPPIIAGGSVRFGCASAGLSTGGPDGDGTLAQIVFTALKPGAATLNLRTNGLADIFGDDVGRVDAEGAQVLILATDATATPAPEETTTPTATPSPITTASATTTPTLTSTVTATATTAATTTPSAAATSTATPTSSPTKTSVPLTPTPSTTSTQQPTTTPTPQPSVVATTTPQHTTTVIASTRTVVATTRTVEPDTTPSTTNTPEHTSTPVPTSTSTQQPTAVPTTTATPTTVPPTPTMSATSTATVESTSTATPTVTATATATTTAVSTTTSPPRPRTATPRATTTRLAATSSPAAAPTRSVRATQTAERNSSVLGTSRGPTGIVLPDTGSGGAKGNNPQTPIGLAAAIAALFLTTALIALRHPRN